MSLAAALLLLEVLPVEAWLLVISAYAGTGADNGRSAVPFALVLATPSVAWALRGLGRVRPRLARWLVLPALFVLVVLFVRLSPLAYGTVPGDPFDSNWLNALGDDFLTGGGRIFAGFWLLALVAYLWWRGTLLGRRLPLQHDALERFKFGLIAIIVAVIVASTGQTPALRAPIGALAFLLPVEVFCGLLGAAIARAALTSELRRRSGTAGSQGPWLRASIILSALVVGVALVVSLVLNYGSVSALLAHLGPVGEAINGAVRWLVDGFAYLLFLVLDGPIQAFRNGFHARPQQPGQLPACQPGPTITCNNLPKTAYQIPPGARALAIIIMQGITLVTLVLVAIYLLRIFLADTRLDLSAGADDERESLDARGLFNAQVRDLFGRLRRHAAPEHEHLDPNSVRSLYQEVLSAAAHGELARATDETPDEYALRLAGSAPLAEGEGTTSDLQRLSEAYDTARYGGREPAAAEMPALRERARRLIARLR